MSVELVPSTNVHAIRCWSEIANDKVATKQYSARQQACQFDQALACGSSFAACVWTTNNASLFVCMFVG